MKIAILDDYLDSIFHLPCYEKLAGHDVTILTQKYDDPADLAGAIGDAEAVVLFRERTKITDELLAHLPGVKLISQRSAYPHIDVDACTKRGVLLCSKQGAGKAPSYAAAEMTWALIMASARQIVEQNASLKAGQWQMGIGKTLRGRTLGILGYGKISRVVAGYARAFGMNVLVWASEASRKAATEDGLDVAASREAFFATPDIVTVHMRLTSETRGTITADDLARMRPDSLFVNTSRAGLVAPGALLAALDAGRPGKAAVDVLDTEPLIDADDRFANHPNVLATPHVGFVTEDELDMQFGDIFDQVVAYANGDPIHMINPEVWQVGKAKPA
ncbi:D-3-phosphoglycerate dehydrogenase [Thalassospira sp. MBR-102]|jgi:D-3-phosphoglycerate dehydrogenase|uniref:D-2-hydroxyacid dehydrogenase family protein n=1 Tax=Thalassospira sp. MBR-102 TaxID=3156466 RepID=UPI003390CF46